MSDASEQQRILEQQLRIQELEAAVDTLHSERAALLEQIRELNQHTGLEGATRELKWRARAKLGALRRRSPGPPATPVIPLSTIPAVPAEAPLRWEAAVNIAGDVRPGLLVDPPYTVSWDVDVPVGTVVEGAIGMRPAVWELNQGGFDLVIEVSAPGSDAPLTTHLVSLDPGARLDDRRWVPWRLEVPGSGARRITLRTAPTGDAAPDYAWAAVGAPGLIVPGLAPRIAPPRAVEEPDAPLQTPTIAILLPVHDPAPGLLDRTLASVFAQTSASWELCIVDDGSTEQVVRDRLARAAAEDDRVKLHRHDVAQGISGATNAALKLTTAPFVATLDHDDLLAPDAIARAADELAAYPTTDLLYSDNDLVAAERHRFAAALKPDWSPDLLRACMYTLHLSVYRRSLVEDLGGWRSAFDGAQDHDLVLRLMERTQRIRHLPRILAHWRAHGGSAALGELAKPAAYERGREAVAEHLARTGQTGATVERLPQAGRYRVRRPRRGPVHVRFLPAPGATDEQLLVAIDTTRELLRDGDTVAALGPDAPAVDAGVLLLIDGLATPTDADAIDELAGHVEAGAAAAGGLVVDAVGRLVAGGVAFPEGLPVLLHVGADPDADEAHPSLTMVSNRLAVAGAVAFPAGAASAPHDDGPLSLIARSVAAAARGRVVWSPHARFVAAPELPAPAWPVGAAIALDRNGRPDPFWNPQRWSGGAAEVVPESVHENQLLDVVDP